MREVFTKVKGAYDNAKALFQETWKKFGEKFEGTKSEMAQDVMKAESPEDLIAAGKKLQEKGEALKMEEGIIKNKGMKGAEIYEAGKKELVDADHDEANEMNAEADGKQTAEEAAKEEVKNAEENARIAQEETAKLTEARAILSGKSVQEQGASLTPAQELKKQFTSEEIEQEIKVRWQAIKEFLEMKENQKIIAEMKLIQLNPELQKDVDMENIGYLLPDLEVSVEKLKNKGMSTMSNSEMNDQLKNNEKMQIAGHQMIIASDEEFIADRKLDSFNHPEQEEANNKAIKSREDRIERLKKQIDSLRDSVDDGGDNMEYESKAQGIYNIIYGERYNAGNAQKEEDASAIINSEASGDKEKGRENINLAIINNQIKNDLINGSGENLVRNLFDIASSGYSKANSDELLPEGTEDFSDNTLSFRASYRNIAGSEINIETNLLENISYTEAETGRNLRQILNDNLRENRMWTDDEDGRNIVNRIDDGSFVIFKRFPRYSEESVSSQKQFEIFATIVRDKESKENNRLLRDLAEERINLLLATPAFEDQRLDYNTIQRQYKESLADAE